MADPRVRITLSVTLPKDGDRATADRLPLFWLAEQFDGFALRIFAGECWPGESMPIYDEHGQICGELTMEAL